MKLAQNYYDIFFATTKKYHETDHVDAVVENPYAEGTIEHTLFAKIGLMPCSGISRI